jgi:hypothetical protein
VSGAAEAKAITEVLYLGLLVLVSFRSFVGDTGRSGSSPSRLDLVG